MFALGLRFKMNDANRKISAFVKFLNGVGSLHIPGLDFAAEFVAM
jgi:hypothetical protein